MWMRANLDPLMKTVMLTAAMAIVLGNSLHAQPAPILRAHTTEIGGFLGASYGIDKARIMGGGNICYSVIREVMPFAEVSYFPGIGRTAAVSGIQGATATFSLPITDFNFGVHLRVPIPKSRVIPYGVLSFGAIHNAAHTEQIQFPDQLNPGKFVTTPFNVGAETHFATSFGGGLRLYATERLGFRGEFKAYKPTGGIDVFYRATGGFFFQF
jgi:hypothetical protein